MIDTKNPILTLEVEGKIIKYEFDHWDLNLEEYFQAFKTLLVGATFFESGIDDYILEKAQEIEDFRNFQNKYDEGKYNSMD